MDTLLGNVVPENKFYNYNIKMAIKNNYYKINKLQIILLQKRLNFKISLKIDKQNHM